MQPDSQSIRNLIARMLNEESLDLDLSPSWGADVNENYRKDIRNSLVQRLSVKSPAHTNPSLHDLGQRPFDTTFAISISHCPSIGGFAIVSKPKLIGFDIEEEKRIGPAAAKRISCDRDASAPTPAHLWVAKEATYKCLHVDHQPKTLTQIFVHEWEQKDSRNYLFKSGRLDTGVYLEGYGCVIQNSQWLLGFFLSTSQF